MKICNRLILFIGYVVLLALLFFIFYIQIGKLKVFSIVSGSMEPSITTGSLLFHQEDAFLDIQVGDIITYQLDNSSIYVTHRVIHVDYDKQQLLCKGDNNANVDTFYINKQQYVGTVLFHIPYAGYIMLFFNSDVGKSVLGVCALIICMSIAIDMYQKAFTRK